MTIPEAIDALRPFTYKAPHQALGTIRAHWEEAEPILVQEIGNRLAEPKAKDADALFLYAIHLCTEMRSTKAFPHFLRIARLPNLLLDHLLGDILTETFSHMLARTCHGRIDDIKALVEDPTLNEYARSAALRSLLICATEGGLEVTHLSVYCIDLLDRKLECRASNIWNTAVEVVSILHAPGALPLIKAAYAHDLANTFMATPDEMIDLYMSATPQSLTLANSMADRPFKSTESAMFFFVNTWGRESKPEDKNVDLLDVLRERIQVRPVTREPSVSRNAQCPCGSGKKFKKCCRTFAAPPLLTMSVLDKPVRDEHLSANDWMQAGYLHQDANHQWKALECWEKSWEEMLRILPQDLQNPAEAETSGAFEGCEYLETWLADFNALLLDRCQYSVEAATFAVAYLAEVPARFPGLADDIKLDMRVDQAGCLALLGRQEEAVSMLEETIRTNPDFAKPYAALSDMYSFDAMKFNIRPDLTSAARYLQMATQQAKDCDAYKIQSRMEDLAEREEDMREWANRKAH